MVIVELDDQNKILFRLQYMNKHVPNDIAKYPCQLE